MKNNFHNDVDKDNIDIAKMILDDSKKINTDKVFNSELLNNIENSNFKKKFQFRKVHAFATAVAACLVILVGVGYWNSNNLIKESSAIGNHSNNSSNNIASDYSEIYNKMISAVDVYNLMMYDSYGSLGTEKSADAAEPSISATFNDVISESAEVDVSDSDYYDTNEQTENVHEGDIVKTDGKYIYTLTWNEDSDKYKIIITKADGMTLDNIAVIKIPSKKKTYQYISEIYVSSDRLIAVGTRYEEYKYSENIIKSFIDDCLYGPQNIPVTVIYSYDISDRKNPELISTNQQDGSYNSSRLSDGYLYTISNKSMDKITKDNCVPTINGKLMSCDCIYLPEQIDDQSYTVVTSLDINSADDFSNSVAIAGGTSLIYASQDNLYLISNERKDKDITKTSFGKKAMEKAAYEIAVPEKVEVDDELKERLKEYYEVLDVDDLDVDKITAYKCTGVYEYTKSLNIVKYSYEGADINFVADASVDGYSYDNMNFDEHNGYLRLVTTESSDTCIEKRTTYYDADGEFLFYTSDYERSVKSLEETSNVFVLDENLNKKAEIDNIAKGESLYSSRFLGDYGYFVTYENTDPLFSVDFSDMENPKIIGKLKLPGFSNYLHFYTENLLFGFGSETDEESGDFEGLKMEMYNVANGKASQECKLVLNNFDYSDAEENYKALMIDSKKGLIGFAASSYEIGSDYMSYVVYTYKNNNFKKLFEVELENDYDIRGFYIGDYLYIVDPEDGIRVLNLETYAKDKKVEFENF